MNMKVVIGVLVAVLVGVVLFMTPLGSQILWELGIVR